MMLGAGDRFLVYFNFLHTKKVKFRKIQAGRASCMNL